MDDDDQLDGGTAELSEKDLTDLFHHDPLDAGEDAGAEEVAQPAAVAADGEEAEVVVPAEGEEETPPTAEETAAAAAAANGQNLGGGDLPKQIAEAVRDAMKPPAAAAAADATPEYMFAIPPQLQQALEHEDPGIRNRGYSLLIAGALRTAHKQIMGDVQRMVEAVKVELPQQIQTRQTEQSREKQVFDDFYTTHKDLNNPALFPMVLAQARALAIERPELVAGGWNPRMRDALAKRMRALLKWPEPKKPGGKPPHLLNGGSRPQVKNTVGQAKHLDDMFGPQN